MAKKQKSKPVVYLTDQNSSELKEVVSYVEDRISELEMDEELLEENGTNMLPLLRGLVSFLREEHLEEDEEEPVDALKSYDEDEEDDYEEETDELDF